MKNSNADYVFINGKIITVNENDDIAEALVVSGNKIIFVGNNDDAMKYAVEGTEVIDLEGNTMTPGFIDTHAHTMMSGMNKNTFPDLDPSKAPNLDALYKITEESSHDLKPGEWLIMWGYDELRMDVPEHPNRYRLDEIVPNNPVLACRCDGHSGVANTKALETAGFFTDKIKKYRKNEIGYTDSAMNGYLADTAYYDLWSYAEIDVDKLVNALEEESKVNLKAGITGTNDAGGFSRLSNRGYMEAVKQGKFKMRATVMSWSMMGKEHYFEDARMYKELGFGSYIGNDRLKFGLMKIMIDGGSSGPGCAVIEGYSHDPDNHGTLLLTQDEINDFVLEMHKTGHQVTAHASGDKAVEMWLDAIELAQKKYPREDPRHRVEHACIMSEHLVDRMKDLGVIPTPNPGFITLNADRYLKFFGKRCEMLYPLKTYLEKGVKCTLASDNPIIPENPMYSIAAAMIRGPFEGGVVVGENQKIGFLDAVRMHTYNAAYSTFDDDRIGSLEEGKLADLAVFEGNLMEIEPACLPDAKCILTMVDGEIVHRI